MLDDPTVVRELVLLGISTIVGLVVAIALTPRSANSRPGPAVQVYQALLRSVPGFRSAAKRESSSYREQFLATFFITTFIIFAAAIIFFGCSHRMGCK
jgi:hypothetical protein